MPNGEDNNGADDDWVRAHCVCPRPKGWMKGVRDGSASRKACAGGSRRHGKGHGNSNRRSCSMCGGGGDCSLKKMKGSNKGGRGYSRGCSSASSSGWSNSCIMRMEINSYF